VCVRERGTRYKYSREKLRNEKGADLKHCHMDRMRRKREKERVKVRERERVCDEMCV